MQLGDHVVQKIVKLRADVALGHVKQSYQI